MAFIGHASKKLASEAAIVRCKDLFINAANAQAGSVFDQCIGALLSEFPQFSDYLDGGALIQVKVGRVQFQHGRSIDTSGRVDACQSEAAQ